MIVSDERFLEALWFRRSTARKDILGTIRDWEVWSCDGPEFRHDYDRTVTLYVHRGQAVVGFADGSQIDLQPGDMMMITKGASAVWAISCPIHNSYVYQQAG